MIDTVTAAKIAAAGCSVRRVDCGLGPTDLWEFIDAEGDNPSGQSWTTQRDAAAYGAERIDAGLETDTGPVTDCTICSRPIFEGQRVRDYAGCLAHEICAGFAGVGTRERFAVKDDAARAWLRQVIAGTVAANPAERTDYETPAIDPDWAPGRNFDDFDLPALVTAAARAGVLTGPAGATVEYETIRDDDGYGYRWLVYLDHPAARGEVVTLRLASAYHQLERIGDPDAEGLAAAMAILREAAAFGDALLADLDAVAVARTSG